MRFTYVNSCELDRVSILDMDAYKIPRLTAGAARLRRADTAYASRSRSRSIANVTLVDHSGKRVRVETSQAR